MDKLIRRLQDHRVHNPIKNLKSEFLDIKIDRPIVELYFGYVSRIYTIHIFTDVFADVEILQIFHDENLLEIDDFFRLY